MGVSPMFVFFPLGAQFSTKPMIMGERVESKFGEVEDVLFSFSGEILGC